MYKHACMRICRCGLAGQAAHGQPGSAGAGRAHGGRLPGRRHQLHAGTQILSVPDAYAGLRHCPEKHMGTIRQCMRSTMLLRISSTQRSGLCCTGVAGGRAAGALRRQLPDPLPDGLHGRRPLARRPHCHLQVSQHHPQRSFPGGRPSWENLQVYANNALLPL